jgi:hypothetical protein
MNQMINTESIRSKLSLKYDIDNISSNDLDNIIDINISPVDNNNVNQVVDFNDLDYFNNLRRLKIQYCFINREVLEKIIKLDKLEYISFIFCEFDNNIEDLMREINIKNFTIKKSINFRLDYLNNKIYDKLIISDENIYNKLLLKSKVLDISHSIIIDREVLFELDVERIVISYDEYNNNKNIYDNLEYIVEVKSKDDLTIDKIINN